MMNKKKYKNLTSIILPTFIPNKNKKQYVKWALDSLNKTTDSLFELIVIDDGSTATSRKFLKSLIEQFKTNKYCEEIKLMTPKKNIGWTGALEVGIRSSDGKYVCFINDDLVFSDNWLSKMLDHFNNDDDIAAVGPTTNFVSGRQLIKHNKRGAYEEKVNYLIGFCFLIKREALDKIKENDNYIDSRFYPGGSEELDLCIRLGRVGYSMVIARDVFIHHFGNRSLAYLKEFQEGERNFYAKRLKLLEEKYDKESLEVLDEFQQCPYITIGIPSVGSIDATFVAMYPWILQEAFAKFGFNKILPVISPRNLTHLGRNEIVKRAIMYGTEYLWFLDDDMIVHPETLWRLYQHKKDFVSALAYTRLPPYKPCIYKGKDDNGDWLHDLRLKEGLVEVDACGLSCSLIKVSVIKKLMNKNLNKIKKRGGLFHFTRYGEDMNFTEELKKSGVKVWVDTDLTIKHLGQKAQVDEQTFLRHVQQQKQKEEERGQLNT